MLNGVCLFDIAKIIFIKVAPCSYLKFWVFYVTFGFAKFTTNTLKTKQSDYSKCLKLSMCEKNDTVVVLSWQPC